MAVRIKDLQIQRNGGYVFTDPNHSVRFRNWTLGGLHLEVAKYRVANSLPMGPNLMGEIHTQICNEHPEWCHEMDDTGNPVTMLQAGGNLVKSTWRWAKAGFPMADDATFNTRQAICLACPHSRGWRDYGVMWCKLCGCHNGKKSLKLRMQTEKCPDKPSRW